MIVPRRLREGDLIGIVSPSQGIHAAGRGRLRMGMRFLESLGFKTILGKNALRVEDYSAGSPEERGDDINSMFADPEVKAVISSQGGETANSCLPFVDWKLVGENPKIFMGISDITVLLNAIYSRTGLVTFHGNDVMYGFGGRPTKYDVDEFVDRLVESKRVIRPNGERRTVRGGLARGRLMGGNLGCLSELAGTPYFPEFADSIIFLEAFRPAPETCDRLLTQLKQMGVFKKVRGAIIGHIHGLQAARRKMTQMEDILMKVTNEYDFPILKCNDFGHVCSNTVIPIGVEAELDADKREIEILEPCVK